jgi:excisionase family DNA binding protein
VRKTEKEDKKVKGGFMVSKSDNGYLTIGEVAKRMKVSRSWIYKKARAKVIPHVRIGAVIRFVEKDIEEWINKHKVSGCLKV